MSDILKPQSLAELTEILNNNGQVVVDFSKSEGCVYCTRLAPHFKKVAEKSDKTFVEIDVLHVQEVIETYGLQSVPTVLYFQKGEETVTLTGRTSLKLLRELGE